MGWGTGNIGNGSGGLNFKVIGGTSAPTSPKENMIWVNTDVDITGYYFSATEPEAPIEGMVWISTGTYSTVEFNALKKNAIQVYPNATKQYVGGKWLSVVTMCYQNGEWQELIPQGYLYYKGNECKSITGGWEYQAAGSAHGWADGTMTKESDAILLSTTTAKSTAIAITKNMIDLTNITTAYIKLEDWSGTLFQFRVLASDKETIVAYTQTEVGGTASASVANLTGKYYIAAAAINNGSGKTTCRVVEVYVE